MNRSSSKQTKNLSLLNLGQRGVGKTVFLAGSYAELNAEIISDDSTEKLWFDFEDSKPKRIWRAFSIMLPKLVSIHPQP